jgi:hypothetical protein
MDEKVSEFSAILHRKLSKFYFEGFCCFSHLESIYNQSS